MKLLKTSIKLGLCCMQRKQYKKTWILKTVGFSGQTKRLAVFFLGKRGLSRGVCDQSLWNVRDGRAECGTVVFENLIET